MTRRTAAAKGKAAARAHLDQEKAEREAAEQEQIAGAFRERRGVAGLRKTVAALERRLEAEQSARELLLAYDMTPAKVHRLPEIKSRGKGPRIVTVSALSDLHVDETVTPETVNGFNSFDLAEAERRLTRYFVSVVKLIEKEQKAARIRRHVLWVGGDLFSGHIHEDLVESTCMAPQESVLWLMPRIEAGVRYIVEHADIDELTVVWQYGNHGRDGKKPRIATAAEHNFEWTMGQLFQREIKHRAWAKKVRVIAERGYHTYVDVGGFVIRFHHGEGITFQGGVGGLTIPLNKAIAQWNKARWAHLDVLGHWHQATDLANAVINGSLIGHNAYAIRIKAGFEPPQQVFFNIDLDRRMKTGFFSVHVVPRPDGGET